MPDMSETDSQIDALIENAINAGFEVDTDFIESRAFGNRLVALRSGDLRLRLINDRGTLLAKVSKSGESWWDVDLALRTAGVPLADKPLDDADSVLLLCESPNHRLLIRAWSENPQFEKEMTPEDP